MQLLMLHYSHELAPWVVRKEHRQVVESAMDRPVHAYYHHRNDVANVYEQVNGKPYPSFLNEYAFRAFATNDAVHIFVDETETYESALWLLMHELAHTGVASSRVLSTVFRDWTERDPRYAVSDEAHEADFEEQLSNQVADRTLKKLGLPTGLDRKWWRRRTGVRSPLR